jgi:carboxylesterase
MADALTWGLGAATALWAQRELRATWRERRFHRRAPLGPDGLIRGAEPRTYGGRGERALLLFHGYNDSPFTLDGIARKVNEAGWTVRLPLLPGHGRSLRAFDAWTASEVIALARDEYAELRATHRTVVIGGLSMGGAAACWIAAEAGADGVVLYAPMLFVPRPMEVAVSTARLWSLVSRYVAGGGQRSIHDPEAQARSISYGCSTRRSLEALEVIARGCAARLDFVRAPTLVIQSEEDNRLPADQTRRALARLGARDRTVLFTKGAGHVLTVDYGWEQVAATTVEWLSARY